MPGGEPRFPPTPIELATSVPQIVVKKCPAGLTKAVSEPVQPARSPVLECLDRCASALALANHRVDKLATATKRLSGKSSLASSPEKLPEMPPPGRTKQCHGCHGPCDQGHRGYPTGADRCPLEHDERCEGGILEGFDRNDSKWRPCPSAFVYVEDDYYEDSPEDLYLNEDRVMDKRNNLDLLSQSMASLTVPTSSLPLVTTSSSVTTTSSTTSGGASSLTGLSSSAKTQVTSSVSGPAVFSQEGESVSDQVAAARSRLLALKKKKDDLEVLAQLQMEEQREAAETEKLQEQLLLSSQQKVQPKVGGRASLLRARNQNIVQPNDFGYYDGPTLPQIRNVPGLASVVEERVNHVRSSVPSLARRPSIRLGGPQQPDVGRTRSLSSTRQKSREMMFDPISVQAPQSHKSYVEDLIIMDDHAGVSQQRPGFSSVKRRVKQVDLLTADPETDPSDEEECQQMRLVYRRDKQGMKYREWEPVTVESPIVYDWVTDPQTGRQYRKQIVPASAASHSSASVHQSSATAARSRPAPNHLERGPTFVSLGGSEREGKSETKQTIVDWARKCPVLWAEKVSHDGMNAILWLWAFLAEMLEEHKTNQHHVDSGLLEAKLQHALCVLEVCASHSEKTDFDTHGWKIAKLYAHKVQAQLDRGLVCWSDFAEYKANPHPSELIAARQELEQKKAKKKVAGDVIPDRPRGDKLLCGTWNSSKVEGKCDWQVRNPDKGKCNRRHDCSYCIEKGHGTAHHQKSFCGKRVAAGDN